MDSQKITGDSMPGNDRQDPNRSRNSSENSPDNNNLKNLFDSIQDFLFILDLNGNILDVNFTLANDLGFSKSELLGKNV